MRDGYLVRELAPDDAGGMADAYSRNREHLAPWDPRREAGFYTKEGQAAAIAEQLTAMRNGSAAPWVLTHSGGLATDAVRFACAQALERGLHRLEAGTLVHNEASQRVLARCGFELYGLAPEFLFINGAWQDHNLYQRILHHRPL